MKPFLAAALIAVVPLTAAHAQSLSGDQIKTIYPGTWKLTTKKGAKGTLVLNRDGSGRIRVGSYKSSIVWKVSGNRFCASRVTPKGLVETCSTSKRVGKNKYRNSNGSVISR